MSVPSRDLIDRTGPSTASMVPRIRTVGVGGCCAQAVAANKVANVSEAANRRDVVRMAVSLRESVPASHNANPGREYLFHGVGTPFRGWRCGTLEQILGGIPPCGRRHACLLLR